MSLNVPKRLLALCVITVGLSAFAPRAFALTEVPLAQQIVGQDFTPVAKQTDWKAICTDPTVADTANLLIPSSVTRAGQRAAGLGSAGTTVQVCVRYQTGQAITTPLVIKLVGIDSNGVPQLLSDSLGAASWTFDDTAATDLKDAAGNSYCPQIEVDAHNNTRVMALVVTAMVGGGTVNVNGSALGPQIMMRAK